MDSVNPFGILPNKFGETVRANELESLGMDEPADGPERIRGSRMSKEEATEFLQEQGHGVLALAADDESYGIPVSFGYDSEHGVVYLYLLRLGKDSKKLGFCERTERACLIAYTADSRDGWRSVIVTGPLEEIDRNELEGTTSLANREHVDAIMGDNAWFPTIESPEERVAESRRFLLSIDEITGRQGGAYR